MRIFVTMICVYLFIGLLYIGYCLFCEDLLSIADKHEEFRLIQQESKVFGYLIILIWCLFLLVLWPKGMYCIIQDFKDARNRKLK